MAEYLGTLVGNCAEDIPRTGRANCEVMPGKTVALELTSINASYPSDAETFKEELPGYHVANNSQRMYVVKPISGNDPSGGDLATADLGNYGGTTTVGVNPVTVSYQVENGTPCMFKELTKLNKRQMRVFHVDDSGIYFGTAFERNLETLFRGYKVTVYVREVEPTGNTPYQLFVNLDYTNEYEQEKKNRHSIDVGTSNVPNGLIGIVLAAGTGGTAAVVTACSNEDITSDYGEDWSTDMFVNESGGNPTSVTFDSSTGLLTLLPAGTYKVAGAAVLQEGDILGFDGVNKFVNVSGASLRVKDSAHNPVTDQDTNPINAVE